MPGEFITCPDCQGWPACETGMLCLTCGDDGLVWEEYPDDYELEMEDMRYGKLPPA